MESSQIARGRKGKRLSATPPRDAHHGHSRRPDVLSKMPLSCKVVFDVLRTHAMGKAVELPVRELAEVCRLSYAQTRRALRRLVGANLIRWQNPGPGRGHRSVFEVRWTPPSFPQKNDPPLRGRDTLYPQGTKTTNSPKERLPAVAGTFSPGTNKKLLPAKGQARLSCRAHRWAVGEFRRRVQERWTLEEIADMDAVGEDGLAMVAIGLDYEHVLAVAEREGLKVWAGDCAFVEGPDRERAMLLAAREVRAALIDAFAVVLHRAIRRGRIQTGRELAAVVEDVLDQLEDNAQQILWRISEYLSLGSRQAAYRWAGYAIQEALDSLAAGRMQEQAEMVNQVVDASHEECGDSPGVLLSEGAGAPRLPSRGVSPVHGVNGGDGSEPAHGESWTGLGGARRDRKRARFAADCGEGGSAGEGF